jgi:predicted RecA/RadA family phage recombinase
MRAYGFASEAAASAAGYRCEAGPAMTVIIVTQAQLNSGQFVLDGDPKALPIYTAPVGMRIEGGYSQPVFLVGGSL